MLKTKIFIRQSCDNCTGDNCIYDKVRRKHLKNGKYVCKGYEMTYEYYEWILSHNDDIKPHDFIINYDIESIKYYEKIDN